MVRVRSATRFWPATKQDKKQKDNKPPNNTYNKQNEETVKKTKNLYIGDFWNTM